MRRNGKKRRRPQTPRGVLTNPRATQLMMQDILARLEAMSDALGVPPPREEDWSGFKDDTPFVIMPGEATVYLLYRGGLLCLLCGHRWFPPPDANPLCPTCGGRFPSASSKTHRSDP